MAIDDWARAIASIESAGSGGYSALGPVTQNGNRAYGKYQVMDFNIGPWTEKYVGRRMTPQEFLASPEAQEAVFRGEFGGNVEKYGSPQEAASVWFTGQPMSRGANRKDILGTTGSGYINKFNRALGNLQANYATPSVSTKGGQAVEPDQIKKDAMAQSTGVLGMAGAQPSASQRPSFKERFRDPDFWNELALTFHSMSSFPNEAAIRSLESRVASSRERKKLQGQMNKTADWLESQGATQLAAGVRGGGLPVASALGMYQKQVAVAQNPNVQSSQMLRDYSGSVITMRDGSVKVLTSGGQELSGQEAMDFIKASEANYIQGQKDIYGARREGTLASDIELGGEAERVKAEGKDAPAIARANFEDAQTVRSTITNIDNAIAAIDQGAKSGIVYNMLPNMTLASASLSNAMDRLGLDVIGSVTFGALSEGELRLAMETAVPRNLPPAELRQWLVRHKEAQQNAYTALIETAQHFASGGTMDEYLRKIRAASRSSTRETTQQPASGATQPQRRKFDASGNPVRSE